MQKYSKEKPLIRDCTLPQRKKLQHARTTAHIAAFETVLTLS